MINSADIMYAFFFLYIQCSVCGIACQDILWRLDTVLDTIDPLGKLSSRYTSGGRKRRALLG